MAQCSCGCGARVPFGKRILNSEVVSVMNLVAQNDAWVQITGQKPLSDLNWELQLQFGQVPESSEETFSTLRRKVLEAHAYSIGEIGGVSFKLSKLRSFRTEVLLELGRQIRYLSNLGLVEESTAVKSLGLSKSDGMVVCLGPAIMGGESINPPH